MLILCDIEMDVFLPVMEMHSSDQLNAGYVKILWS